MIWESRYQNNKWKTRPPFQARNSVWARFVVVCYVSCLYLLLYIDSGKLLLVVFAGIFVHFIVCTYSTINI